jgi:hypothetical protein
MGCNHVVLAAVLAVGVSGCSKEEVAQDVERHPQPSRTSQRADAPSTSGAPSPASQSSASQSSSERMCTTDCLYTGPLVAVSDAEADWLVRHQYPSASELARAQSLSLDALQQEASMGNPTATAVLGKRISLEQDFLDGQVILRNQALSGNLYAFYAISESYWEAARPNPIDSAAYLRLAYILGDNKAATEIAKLKLNPREIAMADSRALQLFKGFAGDQVTDPRPQE